MNGSSRSRIPLCPSRSFCHVVSASVARAVVMAMPVTTTLGRPFPVDNPCAVTPAITAQCPFDLITPKGQGDIVSTESERVVDGVLEVAITRLARNNIEINL